VRVAIAGPMKRSAAFAIFYVDILADVLKILLEKHE